MQKTILAVLFCLSLSGASAQNDPVKWEGSGQYSPGEFFAIIMQNTGAEKKLSFQINAGGNVRGALRITYDKARAVVDTKGGNRSFDLEGTYDSAKKILLLILPRIPDASRSGNSFLRPDSVYYTVNLQKTQGKMILSGSPNALNRNSRSEWILGPAVNTPTDINMHLLPLQIRLQTDYVEKLIPETVKDTVATILPAVIKDTIPLRKKEIAYAIILDTSFIKIDLYDNGEIDGDIATIILDGKTIMAGKLLSAKANTISLDLSKEPAEHILELFADNLGAIPPNTALLVLTCKNKRYELNLSSSKTTNGSVKMIVKPN